MPRNMSFYYTQQQILDQSKTVTRRLGWLFLKPGHILNACEKCQGLGKGGKIKRLGQIRVISVWREPLNTIIAEDCVTEGFPLMTPTDFVKFFCEAMRYVMNVLNLSMPLRLTGPAYGDNWPVRNITEQGATMRPTPPARGCQTIGGDSMK